uniref:Uncharacterized protein n=1 Tax=Burkholderia sp. (strain CCGE1003) TaxID=640512 RepID=E1T7P6_BURSG
MVVPQANIRSPKCGVHGEILSIKVLVFPRVTLAQLGDSIFTSCALGRLLICHRGRAL